MEPLAGTEEGEDSETAATNTESRFENEFCYTGAAYDTQSGLHYMNARYYDWENQRQKE